VTELDKEQNAFETSGTSPPAQTVPDSKEDPSTTAEHGHEPRKHNYVREGFQNRTRGEKKFNVNTYLGLGYGGVWAFSLFTSWLLRDSKLVAPTYERAIQGTTKAVAAAFSKDHAAIEDSVRKYMNISSLFTGGTLVSVLPIKWREDHKYEIVKQYDEKIYGKDAVENDPTIRAAHEEIRTAPKQTWLSVFASRFTSFLVTYTSAKVIGDQIEKQSTSFGRWANTKVTSNPDTLAQIEKARSIETQKNALGTRPGDPNADTVTTRIFHDAAADGMYTVLTSGALYVFTRVFAPFFDKRDPINPEIARRPPIPASPSARASTNPPQRAEEESAQPGTRISHVEAQARVAAERHEQALHA
jgi:hypothetical protein